MSFFKKFADKVDDDLKELGIGDKKEDKKEEQPPAGECFSFWLSANLCLLRDRC